MADTLYGEVDSSVFTSLLAGAGGVGTITAGISNLGNTAGTSGTITSISPSILFAGGNNITLSQSTAAGSVTITIVGPNTVAAGTATLGMSNLGNSSGTSGVVSSTSPELLFVGGANITLSQSINAGSATISILAAAQTVQPIGTATLGMSNIGNTAGSSGVITGTSPSVVFAGGNNITLSQSTNGSSATVTIIGPSAGAAGTGSFGISTIGNTAGTSGQIADTSPSVVFVGVTNITLSQSTNGASATVTIIGGVPFLRVGMSTDGNTAGLTSLQGVSLGAVVLIGGNNVTLSQTTGVTRTSISIIGPAAQVNSVLFEGLSYPPNAGGVYSTYTSQSIATSALSVGVYGGDGLSVVLNSAGNGRTIGVYQSRISSTYNINPLGLGLSSTTVALNAGQTFFPMYLPAPLEWTALNMLGNITGFTSSAAGTASVGVTFNVYTLNGATLSYLSEQSSATVFSVSRSIAGVSSNIVGGRRFLCTAPPATPIGPGLVYFNIIAGASTSAMPIAVLGVNGPNTQAAYSGTFGAASAASNTVMNPIPGYGSINASVSSASLNISQITGVSCIIPFLEIQGA